MSLGLGEVETTQHDKQSFPDFKLFFHLVDSQVSESV